MPLPCASACASISMAKLMAGNGPRERRPSAWLTSRGCKPPYGARSAVKQNVPFFPFPFPFPFSVPFKLPRPHSLRHHHCSLPQRYHPPPSARQCITCCWHCRSDHRRASTVGIGVAVIMIWRCRLGKTLLPPFPPAVSRSIGPVSGRAQGWKDCWARDMEGNAIQSCDAIVHCLGRGLSKSRSRLSQNFPVWPTSTA